MIRALIPVAAAVAIAGPAPAQSLDPQYERLGTLDGELGGDPITLVAVYDAEYDHSGLDLLQVFGQPGFAIIARSLGPDGGLSRPSLSLSIGPVSPEAETYEITEARMVDDAGRKRPLRATAEAGSAAIDGLDLSPDGALSFSLSLELTRQERDGASFEPVEGTAPVTLTGTFQGQLRSADVSELN